METQSQCHWEAIQRNRGYRADVVKRVQEQRRKAEEPIIAEKAKQTALEREAKIEMLAREAAEARTAILARKAAAKAAAESEGFVVSTEPVVFMGSRYTRIMLRACKVFNVSPGMIKSDCRHRRLVMARHFIMYWASRLTRLPLPQIGRLMGKDHSTVIHGRDKYISKRKAMNRTLRRAR